MKLSHMVWGLGALCLSCGSDGNSSGGSGGSAASGGSGANGGSSANGGSGSTANGGSGASGGSSANGGSGANGGSSANGGSTTNGGSANGGTGNQVPCGGEPEHTGEGTYYDADGSGNCSFDASPNDLMVGAMNQTDYQGSATCGSCAAIDGPSGSVTVRIVDRCPECAPGDIDLSPQAFEKIAALSAGRVAISWKYVPCDVSGNVKYRFKEGSNQWWSAVQVRNHKNAIAKFEYDSGGGTFVEVPRENYNYFVQASGMGPGPYTFRITDVYGNQLTDSNIAFAEAQEVSGAGQFPGCN
ncbi:MAG: expansin EXLX1 family cellulose-binding protein [Polyangiaceae bacterium]